jgi:hypothetical protein
VNRGRKAKRGAAVDRDRIGTCGHSRSGRPGRPAEVTGVSRR